MKIVLQRVLESNVMVNNKIVGEINKGLVLLVGVDGDDEYIDAEWLANKIINVRVFSDANGKMNYSVKDIDGDILCISQFTLISEYKNGNRPSYSKAAKPDKAILIFNYFKDELNKSKLKIESGVFGADMKVSIINDGPVTIVFDSKTKA